jgi:hypothetical protein
LLDPDHRSFTPALGYSGPPTALGATEPPWQIPNDEDYDHGDYLPSSSPADPFPNPAAKWNKPADFMRRAFLREPQQWP